MKKLFLILGIFFVINFDVYGFTQKEKIQETLSKLGIKQALIDETIALDYEIRDTEYFENDEKIIRERVAKLEKLLQKDERNYIAAQALITIFESKISGDYKKYLDLFVKYTPYEYEKTFSKMMYALDKGDMSNFEKYMDEIVIRLLITFACSYFITEDEIVNEIIKHISKDEFFYDYFVMEFNKIKKDLFLENFAEKLY